MGFNYLQTDDRDDYFSQFGHNKPLKVKPIYTISRFNIDLLVNQPNYKCITFTKTIVDMSRSKLKSNIWMKILKDLGYSIKRSN